MATLVALRAMPTTPSQDAVRPMPVDGPSLVATGLAFPVPVTPTKVVHAVGAHARLGPVRTAPLLPRPWVLTAVRRRLPEVQAIPSVEGSHPVPLVPAEVVAVRTVPTTIPEDGPVPLVVHGPTVVAVTMAVVGPTAMGASAGVGPHVRPVPASPPVPLLTFRLAARPADATSTLGRPHPVGVAATEVAATGLDALPSLADVQGVVPLDVAATQVALAVAFPLPVEATIQVDGRPHGFGQARRPVLPLEGPGLPTKAVPRRTSVVQASLQTETAPLATGPMAARLDVQAVPAPGSALLVVALPVNGPAVVTPVVALALSVAPAVTAAAIGAVHARTTTTAATLVAATLASTGTR